MALSGSQVASDSLSCACLDSALSWKGRQYNLLNGIGKKKKNRRTLESVLAVLQDRDKLTRQPQPAGLGADPIPDVSLWGNVSRLTSLCKLSLLEDSLF